MYEWYDVVVVGGRVAGAALATHVVRRGFSALVVERAAFPSDTLSTHLFQRTPSLDRLGVTDQLLATGAPLLTEFRLRMDDLDLSQEHPDLAMLSVRRRILDPILLDNAGKAGADVVLRTRVIGLLGDGGRVTGVRIRDADRNERDVRARVVVGADGRTSTVARLVGARRYNVTDSERSGACAYYEGVEPAPVLHFYTQGPDYFIGNSTDSGLFLAIVLWSARDYPRYKDPAGSGFDASVAGCRPLAKVLGGAQRTRAPLFIAKWQGYFRESAGPGWALVGDAGHFKDPAPGQGISDALRQAEHLGEAIARGIETHTVETHLAAYWRWRDADAAEMYWWAREFGRGGRQSPVIRELFAGIARDPQALRATHEIVFHQRRPFRVLSPPRVVAATGRLLLSGSTPRGEVLAETKALALQDFRRRRLTRHPRFEPPGQPAQPPERPGQPAQPPERPDQPAQPAEPPARPGG
jgi:flavin-dependent dehydrogenase